MSRSPTPLTSELYDYLLECGTRETELLAELRRETAEMPRAQMQIAPEQGQLMRFIVELIGARRCLEIGVFTGYSSLCAAMAMPDSGQVVALDVNESTTAVARRYFERAGLSHKFDLRIGPATESLRALLETERGTFDFAFIDADKANIQTYYENCLELVRVGGVIAIDNVLWGGSVANPKDDRVDTEAIRALNRQIANDDRVSLSMVPVGDGLTLLRRR